MLTFAMPAVKPPVDFHGGAQLVSSMRSVAPGSSFQVAVRISMDRGWHTYWQNPGDAGVPPKITWRLPKGWKAGPIEWPVPHRLIAPEIVSYGYEGQALLMVKLAAPSDAQLGSRVQLGAKVDWLVCREGCIPATANVTLPVQIAHRSHVDSEWAPRLRAQLASLPRPARNGTFGAKLSDKTITLSFPAPPDSELRYVRFFPFDAVVDPSAPQMVSVSGHTATLAMRLSPFAPARVPRLRGVFVSHRSAKTFDIPLRRT